MNPEHPDGTVRDTKQMLELMNGSIIAGDAADRIAIERWEGEGGRPRELEKAASKSTAVQRN